MPFSFPYSSVLWGESEAAEVVGPILDEGAVRTLVDVDSPRHSARRTKTIVAACIIVAGCLAIVAALRPSSPQQSLRAGAEVELSLIAPKHEKHVRVTEPETLEDLATAHNVTSGGPGAWECTTYVGKQDNAWCRTAGVYFGYEYRYFGQENSPCGDCFCCKRRVQKKPKTCAAIGDSCLSEKCCETLGFQCYEKTPYWAMCRQSCRPGPDPTDNNGDHWSCKELGPRAEGVSPPQNYSVKAAPWVAKQCSAGGEDCTKTMCCQDTGLQCYSKGPYWATCKPKCTPGPDPTDIDNSRWECKEIGSRTPGAAPGGGPAAKWVQEKCSAKGADCSETQCCKEAGNQCYVKKEGWSSCMPTCLHGPLLTDSNPDIWNCTPLGGRTPGLAKAPLVTKPADWVSTQCSADASEDCSKTMCCSTPTSQCFAKHDYWATCSRNCTPGLRANDQDPTPWSCKQLGPRTPRAWKDPSLYCFSVVMIFSPEADVMRTQLNTDGGAGIFACEQFDVFSTDGGVFLGDGPLGPIWSQHFENAAVGTTIDGTAGNTRLFIHVWEAVHAVGRYKRTDWIVKADPDAVVIPDRLRNHLRAHTGKPTFFLTCTLPGMATMMFGALEAISRQAMEKYYDGGIDCQDKFPVEDWGEDRWLSACLQDIGAAGTEDFTLVSDGVCRGVDCHSGRAAFHPFKSAEAWQGCYFDAMGSPEY